MIKFESPYKHLKSIKELNDYMLNLGYKFNYEYAAEFTDPPLMSRCYWNSKKEVKTGYYYERI